jgi:hypothetical protein
VRGYQQKLSRAEAEYARYPSQSTLDRVTYLRAIVDLPGSPLTVDQAKTLAWIAAGPGRRLHEVTSLRKRDLTCIKKKRGALVEYARVKGERWVFTSDLGRFLLRERRPAHEHR